MKSLRYAKTSYRYLRYLQKPVVGCQLCTKETIRRFKHWNVVENSFPYDKIARIHHILLPARHATNGDLTAEEKEELEEIKTTLPNFGYNLVIETLGKYSSIPAHFHLHLIEFK